MVKDNEANEKLVTMAVSLALNKDLQTELSNNIATFAIRNADETIAREILSNIE